MQRIASLIQILRFVFSPQAPRWAKVLGVIAIAYTIMPFTWGPLGIFDNIVVPLLSLGLIQYAINRTRTSGPSGTEFQQRDDSGYVVDTDYRVIDASDDTDRST